MKALFTSVILCSSLLLGCASKQPASGMPAFSGETHSNPKLRNDTFGMVRMYMSALGCSTIDSIQSSITAPPTGPEGKKLSKERWLVSGCGKTQPFQIAYTEDGNGGAFFSVKSEPSANK